MERTKTNNLLPSVAMEFNGTIIENEIEGYRTLKVSGRETISNELVVESVHEGGITLDSHLPSRSIQVTYEMKAKTNELFQEQYRALRKLLTTNEEVPIKFADEPTTVYFGRLNTIEVPADDRNNVVSTFIIHCDSPYKFGDLRDDGMKIGKFFEPDEEDNWSDNLSPEYIDREFGVFKRDEYELREFLSNYMPKANGHMKRCFVGMWTDTADEDYILDFHPEHKNVVIGCGFSGNGFKAVPAVGEILSELIIDGKSELDISDFKITRDALKYNFSEQTESLTWGQMRHL